MTLAEWRGATLDPAPRIAGRATLLERLDPERHDDALWQAVRNDAALWRFMADGPFADDGAYRAWLEALVADANLIPYAIHGPEGWSGTACYMRQDAGHGVIEIGTIALGAGLRRTRHATEALHLMIAQAFAQGFRRVEWKCDADNVASRRAALRLGFRFEGVFRQHMVVKGRNRDTAWFALTDGDWAMVAPAHRAWLSDANFDAAGHQRAALRVPGPDPAPTAPPEA